jgi:hypothetical protein
VGAFHDDRIFFTASLENAEFHANNACRNQETGSPIVFGVKLPDKSQIEPDLITLTTLFHGLLKLHKTSNCLILLDKITRAAKENNQIKTLLVVSTICSKHGLYLHGSKILQDLENAKIPKELTESLLFVLINMGHQDAFNSICNKAIIEEQFVPNITIHNALLRKAIKDKDWTRFNTLYTEIQSKWGADWYTKFCLFTKSLERDLNEAVELYKGITL